MRAIGNSFYFLLTHFLADRDRRGRLKHTAGVGRIHYNFYRRKFCLVLIKTRAKHNLKTKANSLDLFLDYAISCLLFLLEITCRAVNIKKIPTKHGYI